MESIQEAFLDIGTNKKYDPFKYEDKFHKTDYMALEYKEANDRRRGEIALYFINRFENTVKKRIGQFNATQKQSMREMYKEEGHAIWRLLVCQRLERWDGSQSKKYEFLNFLAYLYPCADKLVKSELQEKYAWKDGKYTSTDELVGMADALNGAFDNRSAFLAYEASLIGSAFPFEQEPVEQGDFSKMVRMHDASIASKEIGGVYDPRNHGQWSMYENGIIEE